MLVKIEDLQPKNILNFFPSQPLVGKNQVFLYDKENFEKLSFAANLLQISGVEKCLITDTLLGIHYSSTVEKEDVKALVLAELDDYFSEQPQIYDNNPQVASIDLIEALADSFIRPTLNRDKGDIKILSWDKETLTLRFIGHCAGCPYAQNTLNNVIAACLKRYVPQLKNIQIGE